jgi:hypothetical protein
VVVVIGAAIPLLFNRGYYFVDDSQADMYGKLWQIGHRILAGDWSLVNPWAWQAGNYLAEGYWGVLSPVLWLFGLVTHALPNGLVAMTALKMVLFVVAATGTFLLARDAGASDRWSATAAAAAPLAGFTLYMDAASWMNGFTAWALTPLTWFLVRSFVRRGTLLIPTFVLVYSVVSINYVHATLILGLIILATLVEAVLAKSAVRIRAAFYVGVLWGLVTVVIHLPGLLTSPVSTRQSTIENTGLLVADLTGIATSPVGTGSPQLEVFGYEFAPAPLMYIAWFLPLLALIDVPRARRLLPGIASIVLLTVFTTFAVMGPSDLGPLRFPVRVMPYLAVSALVLVAVLLSKARVTVPSRGRLLLMLAFYAVPALLALLQAPRYIEWIAAVSVVSVLGLLFAYSALMGVGPGRRFGAASRTLGILAVSLIIIAIQHMPAPATPMNSYSVPTAVRDYQKQLAGASGDVLVVGTPLPFKEDPEIWEHTLIGNLWYPNGHRVQNLYTAVGNPGYVEKTCMAYNGPTCPELLQDLFTPQEQTGVPLVDLLSVSTVQVIREPGTAVDVPAGWSELERSKYTTTLVRDEPVPPAGSVVWQEDGTRVEQVSVDAMGTSFRVLSVPEDGGRVALSRIPWPGYTVDGGSLSSTTVEGFLLGVDVPKAAEGDVVRVSFVMPGLSLVVASGALAVLLLVLGLVARRRRVLLDWSGSTRARQSASTL